MLKRIAALVACALTLCATTALSQETTGAINGTVRDATRSRP